MKNLQWTLNIGFFSLFFWMIGDAALYLPTELVNDMLNV